MRNRRRRVEEIARFGSMTLFLGERKSTHFDQGLY